MSRTIHGTARQVIRAEQTNHFASRPPRKIIARKAAMAAVVAAAVAGLASTTRAQSLTWTGAGSNNSWDTSTFNNWNDSVTGPTTYADGDTVTFDDSAGSGFTTVVIQAAGVNPFSTTFNNNAYTYNLSNASGVVGIAGSGGVTVNGPGTVNFNSLNSYTGGTFLNGGTLAISADNALGSVPASPATNITFNGGTLAFNASGITVGANRSVLVNGGGATFNNNGNTVTIAGSISGGGGLTLTGSGTTILSGIANTYGGATAITSGTLQLGVATPAGAIAAYTFAPGTISGNTVQNAVNSLTYSGTLMNGASAATGVGSPNGYAMNLGGTQNANDVLATNIPTTGGVYTASAWFSGLYSGNYGTLFRGTADHELLTSPGNELGYYDNSGNTQFHDTGINMAPYDNASWNQITVVANGTTSTYYINGVQVGSPVPFASTSGITSIGNLAGATQVFAQYLADVYVYNTALTGAQVAQLYNANLGPSSNVLPSTTPVSIATGATLDLNSFNQQIASLQDYTTDSHGTVTNGSMTPATLTLAPISGSATFSGTIQDGTGGVSLTMNGSGTQILAGVSTYTGATNVTSGNLIVTGALGNTAVNVNGGTLSLQSTNALGGSASLTVVSGTATISQANNYTGGTTVNGGALILASSAAGQATGTYTVNGSNGLQFGTGVTSVALGSLSGSGSIALTTSDSLPVALTVGGNSASTTFAGTLSGSGTLIQNNTGGGTLTLTGSNTNAGYTVNQGTLALNVPSDTVSRTITLNGGSLNVNGLPTLGAFVPLANIAATSNNNFYANISNTTAWIGMSAGSQSAPNEAATQDNIYQNKWTPAANVNPGSNYGVWHLDNVSNTSFSINNIFWWQYNQNSYNNRGISTGEFYYSNSTSDPGDPIDNPGNWTLFYNNTAGSGLPVFPLAAGLNGDHTTVDLSNLNFTARWISVVPTYNGAGQDGDGIGTILFAQPSTSYQGVNLPNSAVNVTASSAINVSANSALGNVSLSNASTLTLAGAGSLTLGTTTLASNTTLDLGGVAVTSTSLQDAISGSQGTVTNSSGTPVTLTLAPTSGVSTFSGVIQNGNGGVSLSVNGTGGTQILAGANTFTGPATVNGGILQINNSNSLQNNATTVNVNGGLTFGSGVGTVNLASLAGTGNIALTDTGSAAVNLVVGSNGASTAYSGALSGIGSLTKTGSGILSLTTSAKYSYSGATVITGGTLQLPGVTSLPAGATAAYTFNTAPGGIVPNSISPGTYDGTLANSAAVVTSATSPNGYALNLGNANGGEFLQIGASGGVGVPTTGGVYTASAWFSALNSTGYRTLFRGGSANNGDHPVIINNGSDELGFFGNNAGGSFIDSGHSMASLYGSTDWNQLTVVSDGTTSTYYIDGVQVGTVNKTSTTGIFAIGNYQGGGQIFAQYLDDVYVYNTALSPAQVTQLYDANLSAGQNVLPIGTPVSIATGATLDLNGSPQQIASLQDYVSGSQGLVTNSSMIPVTLTLAPISGSATFSGTIQDGVGGISLTMSGSGTQVLAGANSFTGATTINSGTLNITGSLGNTAVNVNGGTLGLQSINALSGSASLTVTSGTAIISQANNYTGGTVVNGGAVILASGAAGQPTGTYTVNAVNGLQFGPGVTSTSLGSLTGTGSIALTTNGDNLPVALTIGGNNASTNYAGTLTGSGGLTKTGNGILSLTNSSYSYAGATIITGGTLQLAGSTAVPSGATAAYTFSPASVSGTTVSNTISPGSFDGTLQNSAAVQAMPGSPNGYAMSLGAQGNTNNNFLQIAGTGIPSSGTYTASAWFSGLNGPGFWRTLFRGFSNDHQAIVDTGSYNLGFFDGNGGHGFQSTGYSTQPLVNSTAWNQLTVVANGSTSTYYIDGVNVGSVPYTSSLGIFAIGNIQGGGQVFAQYLDDVYIYNSALSAAQVTQLYNANLGLNAQNVLPVTTPISMATGATLDINGRTQQIASLQDDISGSQGTVTNSSAIPATLILAPASGSTTFSGVIQDGTGGMSLTVNGTGGTEVLAGINTYTGPTTVNGGTLVLAVANTITGAVTVNGGTLNLSNANALQNSTLTPAGGNIAFDQSVGGNAFTVSGLSGSGSFALQNNAPSPAPVTLNVGNNDASSTYSGVMTGSGSLVKIGNGVLTLTNSNTNAGFVVNQGTLALNVPSDSVSRSITLNGGTLALNGLPGPGAIVPLANIIATSNNNAYSNISNTTAWVGMSSGSQSSPDLAATQDNNYPNKWTPAASVNPGTTYGVWELGGAANTQFNIAGLHWWQYDQSGYTNRGMSTGEFYYSNATSNPGDPIDNPGNWTLFYNNTPGSGLPTFPLSQGLANDSTTVDLDGLQFAARWISIVPTYNGPGQDGDGLGTILFAQPSPTSFSGTNLPNTAVNVISNSTMTIGAPSSVGAVTITSNNTLNLATSAGPTSLSFASTAVASNALLNVTSGLAVNAGTISGSGSVTVTGSTASLTFGNMTGYSGITTINQGTLNLTSTTLDTGSRTIVLNGATMNTGGKSITASGNLIDRWTFAGNTNDSVGTTNGVNNGAILSSTGGKFGNGAVFLNGTGANVNMGALPSMTNGTQARTISAWVQQTATPANNYNSNSFGFYPATNGGSTGFYFDNNNGPVFTEFNDDTGPLISNASMNNTWHLLTATWDGGTTSSPADNVQIYIDGALATTVSSNANGGSNILNNFGIDIGRPQFQGYEDDMRIYNTALSASQVAGIYNGGIGDIAPGANMPNTALNVTASSTINVGGSSVLGNATLTNASTLTLTGGGYLSLASTTLTDNTTLDLNGVSASVGSLYDTGATVTLVTNGGASPVTLTLAPAAGVSTFGGTIQDGVGGLSLAVNGVGTQVLTGSNTYTGGTTLLAGTLNVGSSNAIGTTGAITFGGGILQYSSANTTDYSNRLNTTAANQQYNIDTNGQNVTWANSFGTSGSSLTKLGPGTLYLTSTSNTYTGATTLAGGTLNFVSGALGSGNVTFTGGTLQYPAGNTQDLASRIKNSTGPVAIDTNGNNLMYSSPIGSSNTGGLSKIGGGTLTLGGVQTYSGATLITGGTLQLPGLTVAPAGATAVYSFTNGTVNDTGLTAYNGILNGSASVVASPGSPSGHALSLGTQSGGNSNALEVAGSGVPTPGGVYTASAWFSGLYGPGFWRTLLRGSDHQAIIDTGSYNLGFYGNAAGGGPNFSSYSTQSLVGLSTWNQLTVVADGSTSTYYINGVQVANVAKVSTTGINAFGNIGNGDGGQVFSAYLDDVYMYSGTALSAAQVTQLYSATIGSTAQNVLPINTPVSIATGATLDLNGSSQQLASLQDYITGSQGTVTNSSAIPVTLTLSPASGATTFGGTIQDGNAMVSLTMSGSGTQALSGLNTYSGPTTITGGILSTGSSGTLANGGSPSSIGQSSNAASNLVINGGTLQYAGAPSGSTDRLFTVGSAGATIDAASSITFLGNTANGSNAVAFATTASNASLTLTNSVANVSTFWPSITDNTPSTTSVTKTGLGAWVLAGTNSYTGGTTVSGGALLVGSPTALGNPTTGSPVAVYGAGVLDLNDVNTAIFGLSDGGAGGNSNGLVTSNAGSATLTINGSGQTYSGKIADGTTGQVSVVINSGTQTFGNFSGSGPFSSYTGGTEVKGGAILVGVGIETTDGASAYAFGGNATSGGDVTVDANANVLSNVAGGTAFAPHANVTVNGSATFTNGAVDNSNFNNTETIGQLNGIGNVVLYGNVVDAGGLFPIPTNLVIQDGGSFSGNISEGAGTYDPDAGVYNDNGLADSAAGGIVTFTGHGVVSGVSLANVLTLSGQSTYTGGTTVTGGTLLVSGTPIVQGSSPTITIVSSATGLGPVTVQGTTANSASHPLAGNSRLGGNGTVGGDIIVASGGIISPGTTTNLSTIQSTDDSTHVATLGTYGNQVWNGGGTYVFKTTVNSGWSGTATVGNGYTDASSSSVWGVDPSAANQDFLYVAGTLDIESSLSNPFILDVIHPTTPPGNVSTNTFLIAGGAAGITQGGISNQALAAGQDLSQDFVVLDNGVQSSHDTVTVVQDGPGGTSYDLQVTVVTPEPGSLGLLGIASLGLLRRRRGR